MRHNHSDVKSLDAELLGGGIGWRLRQCGYETLYGGKVHLPGQTSASQIGFEYFTDDERDRLAEIAARRIRSIGKSPFAMVASFVNPHDICYYAILEYLRTVGKQVTWNAERDCEVVAEELARIDRDVEGGWTLPSLPPNFEISSDEPEAIDQCILGDRAFRRYARENWTNVDWRRHRALYSKLTERVDRQIGIVLNALDVSGLMDNTMVIFVSDHGDPDGAHRLEHKTVPYEEAIRVPLIVRHPDTVSQGAINSSLVSTGLDLLPTVMEAAGCEPDEELSGEAILGRPSGDRQLSRNSVCVESQYADTIVESRWKYTRWHSGARAEQLYDLDSDPYETTNLARVGSHSKLKARLRRALADPMGG